MLHLIRLELKKGRMTSLVWGALLADAIMLGFLFMIYMVDGSSQIDPPFSSYREMFDVMDTIVRATFTIYASALLARLIIGEFRDKTMAQLFTYPISRKKLIFAKLSIVFVWVFANIVLGNLLLGAVFLGLDAGMGYIGDAITAKLLYQHGVQVLTYAVAASGMSLLPLAVGLRRKSAIATVISSIFIVMIMYSNNAGFSLSAIVAIPLSLGVLGILLAYLSFRNIDKVDAV